MTTDGNVKSQSDADKKSLSGLHYFVVVSMVSLATAFVWLFVFQIISIPAFLNFTGLSQAQTIVEPSLDMDPYTLFTIGELTKSGVLISAKELWSLENSLYSTVITFLIGINGLIGALAFVFIKNTSNEKAQEAATAYSKTYVQSIEFRERVEKEVQSKIKGLQDDYDDKLDKLDLALETISTQVEKISELEDEMAEMRRHISYISKTISMQDQTDSAGGNLTLRKRGRSK